VEKSGSREERAEPIWKEKEPEMSGRERKDMALGLLISITRVKELIRGSREVERRKKRFLLRKSEISNLAEKKIRRKGEEISNKEETMKKKDSRGRG